MNRRESLFGVTLDALTMDETVQRCLDAVRRGEQIEIGMVNAAKLVTMRRDPRLAAAVAGCDLVLADGQAVVWAGRVLGVRLPERVAGIDLFMRCLLYTSRNGYFDDSEQGPVADAVADSGAQLLFLGMTSPKKEIFTAGYGKRTGAHVVHGVGGSFDILAGITKRAPLAWQRMGLEWFYRALQEPRRLGKRYLTTNTAFLLMTVRELIRRTPSAGSANRSH